jgi:hypothetical protein
MEGEAIRSEVGKYEDYEGTCETNLFHLEGNWRGTNVLNILSSSHFPVKKIDIIIFLLLHVNILL